MASDKTKLIFNPLSGTFDSVQDVATHVEGPSSATDLAIAIYNGTTGKLIKNSLASVQSDGRVTAAADAANALDLVTKQQLDAAIQGLDVKEGVRAATTANITLSGNQTIDGISAINGDRILVKNQSAPAENGVYLVDTGTWPRVSDSSTAAELNGALVTVKEGNTQANSGWYQYEEIVSLNVDPVNFNQFFGAGTYTADGNGIELSGSTFALELDGTTLSKGASGLKVADLGIANAQISNSAAIAYSKLNLSSSVVNGDIVAGVDASKLADGSVSNTELQYINSLSSNAQDQLNSKIGFSVSAQNTNFAASAGITYIVDSSGGAIAVTLPTATANTFVIIKDAGAASTNAITLTGTVDGEVNPTITSDYGCAFLVANGSAWFKI